jgi:hypothetical protein
LELKLDAKKSILDLSTAHVSVPSRGWLDEQSAISLAYRSVSDERPVATIAGFGYGWFLTANPPDGALEAMPEDISRLLEYARSHNCDYVVIDRDADTLEELPAFE